MYAIYVITNTVNAKQYVGIAVDLERRWRRHRNAREGQLIHKAIKKYGIDAFVFTHIADAFDAESAKVIERMLIVERNTKMPHGYNMTDGGDGTMGMAKTEEHKQKLKTSNKKTWADLELRKQLGEKISAARKGKPNGRKGKPNGRKGVAQSPEHVAKRKAAFAATMAIKKAQKETA
jgi:group I intron endonuclease